MVQKTVREYGWKARNRIWVQNLKRRMPQPDPGVRDFIQCIERVPS